jgi:hypothetical protein
VTPASTSLRSVPRLAVAQDCATVPWIIMSFVGQHQQKSRRERELISMVAGEYGDTGSLWE